jgi:hypothetical protein
MFPYRNVALDILWRKKIEAQIFFNHLVLNIVQGLAHILQKKDAFLLHLAAALARINWACSQLLQLSVLLDTYRAFYGYLLPSVNTNNMVFD